MPAVLAGRTGWVGVPFGSVRAVSTPSQPPPAFAGGGAKAKLPPDAAPAFESPLPNPQSPLLHPQSPIPAFGQRLRVCPPAAPTVATPPLPPPPPPTLRVLPDAGRGVRHR